MRLGRRKRRKRKRKGKWRKRREENEVEKKIEEVENNNEARYPDCCSLSTLFYLKLP